MTDENREENQPDHWNLLANDLGADAVSEPPPPPPTIEFEPRRAPKRESPSSAAPQRGHWNSLAGALGLPPLETDEEEEVAPPPVEPPRDTPQLSTDVRETRPTAAKPDTTEGYEVEQWSQAETWRPSGQTPSEEVDIEPPPAPRRPRDDRPSSGEPTSEFSEFAGGVDREEVRPTGRRPRPRRTLPEDAARRGAEIERQSPPADERASSAPEVPRSAKSPEDVEDPERPRRRRRRRRGKRREDESEVQSHDGDDDRGRDDDEFEFSTQPDHDELVDDAPPSQPSGRRPRRGDRDRDRGRKEPHVAKVEIDDADDDPELDDIDLDIDAEADDTDVDDSGGDASGDGARHRRIPTWEETIGHIVDANLSSRSKNPQRGRGGGSGGRRGGGGGGGGGGGRRR